MSTPTDPYSRPESEGDDNDILDPLPEDDNELESTRAWSPSDDDRDSLPAQADEAEKAAWDKAFRGTDEPEAPVTTPVPDQPRKESSFDSNETRVNNDDSQVRRSIFDRDSAQRDNTFDSADRSDDRAGLRDADDATVVNAYADKETVVSNTAAGGDDVDLSTAPVTPQRKSVFGGSTTSATSTPYTEDAPVSSRQSIRRAVTPVPEEPAGRGWAHVGVFFATLILVPVAWYLLSDAGIRLGVLSDSQWETTQLDWMPLLEFLGGIVCIGLLWYMASHSAFGAGLFGVLVLACGLVALFAPSFAQNLLHSQPLESFGDYNAFTGNVVHHLEADFATGRIALYGFLLLMTSWVAKAARRDGQERGDIEGRRKILLNKHDD